MGFSEWRGVWRVAEPLAHRNGSAVSARDRVLLRHRDRAVTDWRWRVRSNVFEDPRLEITSSFAIDLDARLALAEDRGVEPGIQRCRTCRLSATAAGGGWGV